MVNWFSQHGVTALCDVRSSPYSRFTPQFNRESLKDELARHRIIYLYLGAELGPRSSDPTCYEGGKVQYNRLAGKDIFQLSFPPKRIKSSGRMISRVKKSPIRWRKDRAHNEPG